MRDSISDTLLEIKNVTKIFRYGFFGFKFRAVDNVTFTLHNKPSVLAIVGESGSGKSTLAKIILGIHVPEYGCVFFKGKKVHDLKGSERRWFIRNVQGIFQNPYESFNPLKKVYKYLQETTKNLVGINDPSELENYIDETLSKVGLRLGDIKDKYVHEFSGGELQRIGIARAMLSNPSLIIADEPVSMLDASLRVSILNVFKRLREEFGVSFIYITHDLSTASYVSDQIAVMYRGVIIEYGNLSSVLSEPLHPYTQSLVESVPVPERSRREIWLKPLKLSGIEEKEFIIKGCRYRLRCPFAHDKCFTEPPNIQINKSMVKCWLYATNVK